MRHAYHLETCDCCSNLFNIFFMYCYYNYFGPSKLFGLQFAETRRNFFGPSMLFALQKLLHSLVRYVSLGYLTSCYAIIIFLTCERKNILREEKTSNTKCFCVTIDHFNFHYYNNENTKIIIYL